MIQYQFDGLSFNLMDSPNACLRIEINENVVRFLSVHKAFS